MKRPHIYLVVIIAVVVLVVVGQFGISHDRKRQIVGTVTDALSGEAVYKARIIVGGRSTVRHLDKNFKITNLKPGIHELRASSPGYETQTKKVNLKSDTNFTEIRLKGKEIPGLDHIIVFADSIVARGIQLELRFVNEQGIGIRHFPRLALTMDAKLSVRLGTKENPQRGRLIYSGPVELFWDSGASLGKNKGIIAKNKFQVNPETDGNFGILDVVLHTGQGDFEDTIADILLRW
jgi:hypothetical protein